MQFHTARACAKAILFGEHAVVYGRPAIGVPVTTIGTEAQIREGAGGATIIAEDLDQAWSLSELGAENPLGSIIRATLRLLDEDAAPNFLLTLHSTIPIARGLGSGTALSTAVVRALAEFYGARLTPAQVSALVFETEKLYHGTPSGVDNTIIAYQQPVCFVKGSAPERLRVARPFRLVIADTGVASETKTAVGDVRAAWLKDPQRSESVFDAIAAIVGSARQAIEYGWTEQLGPLMDANQAQLRLLAVSSPQLEKLIDSAKVAGAAGAKLSGGGRGGCMLALVEDRTEARVVDALRGAGAAMVLISEVPRN